MQVSCLQYDLKKALGIVGRFVPSRSTLPVLHNVLVEANGDGLIRIAATDLESGVSYWVNGKVEEPGAITVPARTLGDLVKALPEGQVTLSADSETQTLNVGASTLSSTSTLKGIDAEQFAGVPASAPEDTVGISIPADRLCEAIDQVAFAATSDESRPILTGVLMEFAEDQLTLAAADGYRISVRTIALDEAVSDPFDIIVPAQALKELGRIVDDDDETVTVFVNAKEGQDYQVLFECPGTLRSGTLLVSQLIEGNFPEYENIIPDRHDTRTVVDTALLLKACKRSQVFAREVLKKMYINITPGETDLEPGQINVFAQSPETGDDATDIEATVEGEGIEIVFNVNFVLDVLSVIDAPQVALTTTTAANPGTFRPVGEDEINFTHVIMPMNLTRDGRQQ